jgi:hypothetical protein
MFPFLLYVATGIVDGLHVLALLMQAVLGATARPVQYIALVGTIVLLCAGVTALFSARIAAYIALVACLANWTFYLPALWVTLASGRAQLAVWPQPLVVLVPVALLMGATSLAVGRIRGRRHPRWMFADATPRARDWTLVGIVVAIAAIVVIDKLAIGTR